MIYNLQWELCADFPPWSEVSKANNAVSLSAATFVAEWSKSDQRKVLFSEVLCPIPR